MQISNLHTASWALALTLVALVKPSSAVDGVIEINHSKALAGGVTPSDTPGYPVLIGLPGSYRLTGNLNVPDANTTGIEIDSDDVTLDLNGFAILGSVTCSGEPVTSCAPAGSGYGVYAFNQINITVRNGTVRGMGAGGIAISRSSTRIEDMHVSHNGGTGIHQYGVGSTIRRSITTKNGSAGIMAGDASLTDNVSLWNGSHGIYASGGTVQGNTSARNAGSGILARNAITVNQNASHTNEGFGLLFQLFVPNTIGGYANNTLSNNTAGTVSGGVQTGINVCNNDTTCP